MASEYVKAEVGQLWRCTDPRAVGENERVLRLVEIDEVRQKAVMKNVKTGKTTKVQLERLRPGSTGYELVKEPDHGPEKNEAA